MGYKGLPLFEFKKKDKKNYIEAIAIVDAPAIKSNFYMFANEDKHQYFVANEPQKMIAGLLLIPQLRIYRANRDEQGNIVDEFYGFFSAETIAELRNDFMKSKRTDAVNFMHVNNAIPDGTYMVESYIVESDLQQKDLKQRFNIDSPLGSWFVQYHVEDLELFNQIKEYGMHGFSIQGYFDEELISLNNQNKNKSIMNKIIEKFKAVLVEMETELADAPVDKIAETGQQVKVGKVGEPVSVVTADPNGQPVDSPCPDGQYVLENGDTIDCKGGMLVSRTPAKAPEAAPVAAGLVVGDVKPQGKEAPKTEVPANSAASGETKQVADTQLAAYPWDKCMEDQKKAGYSEEVAAKICGKIKSENARDITMTTEQAVQALEAEGFACKKKEFADVPLASGDTAQPDATPEVSAKTLGDLVDVTKDGTYDIAVTVMGGKITEATVSAEQELVKAVKMNADLQLEIEALKAKLKLPVTTPIVNQVPTQKFTKEELAKMTPYERNAVQRGFRVIK